MSERKKDGARGAVDGKRAEVRQGEQADRGANGLQAAAAGADSWETELRRRSSSVLQRVSRSLSLLVGPSEGQTERVGRRPGPP